jgi:long-chain fatty acid transport protein
MARLGKMELMLGAQALYGAAQLTPSAATTTSGGDGGNAVGWLPGGSVFYVMSATPDLKLGVGVLNYFGLGLQYDQGWVGRYFGQKGALLGISVVPTLSYKMTEKTSFGVGLNAMYGTLRGSLAIQNPLSQPDGAMDYSSDVWGFGANLGILFDVSPDTRIGLTWLTAVKLGFKDVPTFTGLSPLVQGFMVGVHQQLGPNWSLMGDVGYEQWSQFGMVEVTFDSTDPATRTTEIAFQDTWHVALGAQYRPAAAWTFSAGAAYDTSMMADADRTVLAPTGAALRVALGAQWSITKTMALGLEETLAWGGSLPLNQTRGSMVLDGTYRDSFINMVGLNLRWQIE